MNVNKCSVFFFVLILFSVSMNCGGGHTDAHIDAPPTIAQQPVDQVLKIGESAAINVIANGSLPIHYEWRWNGVIVSNNDYSVFSTPPIVSSDNQSTINVTLTNAYGSICSKTIRVDVLNAPRSPSPIDLRFKHVDAFPYALNLKFITNIIGGDMATFLDTIGTPLGLSSPGPNYPLDTSWSVALFDVPYGLTGYTTFYKSGLISNLSYDIEQIDNSYVVNSLDFSQSAGAYAFQATHTSGIYKYTRSIKTLPIVDIQKEAAAEGILSHVITAISLIGDKVTIISQGWDGDGDSRYDVDVEFAKVDTFQNVARTLADNGYLISAIGGNSLDGYIFVGTKMSGDSRPRPLIIWDSVNNQPIYRGFAYIGHIFIPPSPQAINGVNYWLLQQ